MPELPEVETMRRGILAAQGSRITGVSKPRCSRKPIEISPALPALRRRVLGQSITAITRAGKRVVLRLSSDDALVIEPRMTGLVLVEGAPTKEHLRLCLELAGGPLNAIHFWDRRGLGSVKLFSEEEFAALLGPSQLGPDALELDAELFAQRLAETKREIKVALLDQKAIAGIGNLYAAEILHVARIDPRRPCCELKPRHWRALAEATGSVLQAAIRYEGSTLNDGTYRNALNKAGGYQNEHRVYARTGETCPSCRRGKILRIVQAQRATFYCPQCQK